MFDAANLVGTTSTININTVMGYTQNMTQAEVAQTSHAPLPQVEATGGCDFSTSSIYTTIVYILSSKCSAYCQHLTRFEEPSPPLSCPSPSGGTGDVPMSLPSLAARRFLRQLPLSTFSPLPSRMMVLAASREGPQTESGDDYRTRQLGAAALLRVKLVTQHRPIRTAGRDIYDTVGWPIFAPQDSLSLLF